MFDREYIVGLRSRFIFKCESCQEEATLHTDIPVKLQKDTKASSSNITQEEKTELSNKRPLSLKRKKIDWSIRGMDKKRQQKETGSRNINKEVVVAAINASMTHAQIQELFSTIGINCPSQKTFTKYESIIGESIEKILHDYLLENGKIERRMALKADGKIDSNGIVDTCVIVDGSWCTRSYGNRYTALSGCGVVIGFYSKRLLHVGIRNKYCCICMANRQQESTLVPEHRCFMNWSGSSTAMESDILVEAFRVAPAMHKLRYTKFIADGDSSTHSEIITKVSYGRIVEKIECANHACKCLKKRLYNKCKESAECRKFLSGPVIKKLCDFARKAIVRTTTHAMSSKDLIRELNAIPLHFFRGDHRQCPSCCQLSGKIVELETEKIPSSAFISHIYEAFDTLIRRARLLIGNGTSNLAEYFMSIVARFIGGKNIMVSKRGRYNTRVTAAGIRYAKGHLGRQEIFRKSIGATPTRQLKKLTRERIMASLRKKNAKPKSAYLAVFQERLLAEEIKTMVPTQLLQILTQNLLKMQKWLFCSAYSVQSQRFARLN